MPPLVEVRQLLQRINHAGIKALAAKAGPSYMTLLKIRQNITKEPGYDTVRAILLHIDEVMEVVAHHSREYRRECEQAAKGVHA